MAKNIVVFSDGTGQDGGVRPEQRVSNIYKMYRAARVSFDSATDPAAQVTFYDPGLGTDIGATALTAPVRFMQKLLGSVEGRGITANIADCYAFILDHYAPGDRIFLFGFSRGAYTVRCVADLLRLCGVPTKTPTGPLLRFRSQTRRIAEEATLTVLEHGAGHPRGGELEAERDEVARRFRVAYGSEHHGGEAQRANAAPYFIGVFDTVAALGARGLRRFLIQCALYGALTSVAALAGWLVSLPLAPVARYALGIPSPATHLLGALVAAAAGAAWLRYRQRSEIKKTIRDYPKPGDVRTHYAEWRFENFNRLLSRFVTYARSANAIDETRADFDRVPWGPTAKGVDETAGIPTFQQFFFAGNHSDIGGSYPEVESRLSDIALVWMLQEAVRIPEGLRIGPVYVNGAKLDGTGEQGTALHLYPVANGVQHCEIAATRDRLDAIRPRWLAWLLRNQNYALLTRALPPDATVHPSVAERLALPAVQQTDGLKAYRPAALRPVMRFAHHFTYEASISVATS